MGTASATPAIERRWMPAGWLLPLACILAWWIRDLSFQWASLPEYRFGWMVVILTGYLILERWPSRPVPMPARDNRVSMGLALAGCPLLLIAELYKNGVARVPWTSLAVSIACALFAASYVRLVWGPAWLRHFLFPMFFFFVAVPMPQFIWNPLVGGLQGAVAAIDIELLRLLGVPAEQQGNLIRLPNCVVGVDEACSGVRSLQSSVMAALFIGDLTFRRAGWKVLFLVAGVVLATCGNILRSLYLSWIAHRDGIEALQRVHDQAGWSVLMFSAIGVALLAWWLGGLERRLTSGRPQ